MDSELTTTEQVIEALEGLPNVMKITGASYRRAFNWKSSPTFPSNTYAVMTEALKARGKKASPALWGMIEQPAEVAQ